MKFLIDKNISYRICPYLEAAGHEAAHVDSLVLAAADDVEILEHERADAAVIVSADTDFGTLLAAQRGGLAVGDAHPGGLDDAGRGARVAVARESRVRRGRA